MAAHGYGVSFGREENVLKLDNGPTLWINSKTRNCAPKWVTCMGYISIKLFFKNKQTNTPIYLRLTPPGVVFRTFKLNMEFGLEPPIGRQ